VWVYPARSTKTPSYAFDIAQRAGLTPPAEHQALLFPMTHDAEKLLRHWQRAAETVLPWLQAGRDVLFLVEGDASTYATFGHLARTLQALAPGLPVRRWPASTPSRRPARAWAGRCPSRTTRWPSCPRPTAWPRWTGCCPSSTPWCC
jgi:hypothetical protein